MSEQIALLAGSANEEQLDFTPFVKDLVSQGKASHGLENSDKPIAQQAVEIADLAGQSMALGFSIWSHRMTTEYVQRFGSPSFQAKYLDSLLTGQGLGSTALATALVDNSGAQPLPITFREVEGGFSISGHIPWASNLRTGTVVVFGARNEESEQRALFASVVGADGLLVKPAGQLLGLNGTSSGSIRFESHFVPEDQLLTNDCPGFFRAMRPRFLLLQSAFCLGLARASLSQAEAAGSRSLGALIATKRAELEALEVEFQELGHKLAQFSPDGPDGGPLPFVSIRLRLALIAQEITRLELAVVGGRGYFVEHETSRRVRESLFLSIQAPTEEALRWELQQFH
jgi:alkylation response protein AidB-like acyl-CoA dehydrogenase